MFGAEAGTSLDTVAHTIQVALTPIFLLSGIAALLNVFSTRLARVSDKVDQLAQRLEAADAHEAARLSAQLAFQRRRSVALDVAVVLGAIGGGATCCAALALFVGSLRDATVESALFVIFGLALACTIGALAAFVFEMLLASRGLREEADRRSADAKVQSTGVSASSAASAASGKTG